MNPCRRILCRAGAIAFLLLVGSTYAGQPILVGQYTNEIQAWHVRLTHAESNACVAGWGGYDSLQVISVTNQSAPQWLAGLSLTYSGDRLTISPDGNLTYMAGFLGGIQFISITNPTAPQLLGTYNNGNSRSMDSAVTSDGTTLFVGDDILGLEVLSIANPASPVRVGVYTNGFGLNSNAVGVALSPDETTLFLCSWWGGMRVFDVSTPTAPTNIANWPLPPNAGPMRFVTLSADGKTAYVLGGGGVGVSAFHILSITNPAAPILLGQYFAPDEQNNFSDIALTRDEDIAFLGGINSGLEIIDISTPTNPVFVAEFVEIINATAPQVTGVALSDDERYLYLAEGVNGLRVLDVSGIRDIDDDGIPNSWELLHFSSPTGAVGTTDSDFDGFSNLEEYVSGTDPNSESSVFGILSVSIANDVTVEVPAVSGRVYTLEGTDDLLSTTEWATLAATTNTSGTTGIVALRAASDSTNRFFRAKVRIHAE